MDTPSTAKRAGPNIGSILENHSIFFITWNCPSPSKEAHKTIVAVNVNNDHSNAVFCRRTILFFGVIKRKKIPIKDDINIISNIFSFFELDTLTRYQDSSFPLILNPSGKWDLNPQPSTPKADNLPIDIFPGPLYFIWLKI